MSRYRWTDTRINEVDNELEVLTGTSDPKLFLGILAIRALLAIAMGLKEIATELASLDRSRWSR